MIQGNTMYAYSGNQQRTGAYAVNGLNQYTAIAGQSITYDNDSNLTGDGAFTFGYDIENRLISASSSNPSFMQP